MCAAIVGIYASKDTEEGTEKETEKEEEEEGGGGEEMQNKSNDIKYKRTQPPAVCEWISLPDFAVNDVWLTSQRGDGGREKKGESKRREGKGAKLELGLWLPVIPPALMHCCHHTLWLAHRVALFFISSDLFSNSHHTLYSLSISHYPCRALTTAHRWNTTRVERSIYRWINYMKIHCIGKERKMDLSQWWMNKRF